MMSADVLIPESGSCDWNPIDLPFLLPVFILPQLNVPKDCPVAGRCAVLVLIPVRDKTFADTRFVSVPAIATTSPQR